MKSRIKLPIANIMSAHSANLNDECNSLCTNHPKRVFPTRIPSPSVRVCVFSSVCKPIQMHLPRLYGVIIFYLFICSCYTKRKKKQAQPMKFSNKLNGNTIKSREFAILKQFLLLCYYARCQHSGKCVYNSQFSFDGITRYVSFRFFFIQNIICIGLVVVFSLFK